MKVQELIKSLDVVIKSKQVAFIQGSPGIGKSDIVKTMADKYGLKLIDIRLSQCDPTDLSGLPRFKDDIAQFVPFDIFPLSNTPIPSGFNGWLIFLDEINAAPKAVQAAAYKLILDRMVGQHQLHKNVIIVCAGNKETDGAITNTISTALRSRFITLPLEPDYESWIEWADEHDIDYRIKAFIRFKKDEGLYDFNPEETNDVYACPRSWNMLNKLMSKMAEDIGEYLYLILGTIGNQAYQFIDFCLYAVNIPDIDTILNGTAVRNPSWDVGMRCIICEYITNNADLITNETQAKNVVTFLDGMGREYSIPFYHSAYKKNPKLMTFNAVSQKMREYAVWLN